MGNVSFGLVYATVSIESVSFAPAARLAFLVGPRFQRAESLIQFAERLFLLAEPLFRLAQRLFLLEARHDLLATHLSLFAACRGLLAAHPSQRATPHFLFAGCRFSFAAPRSSLAARRSQRKTHHSRSAMCLLPLAERRFLFSKVRSSRREPQWIQSKPLRLESTTLFVEAERLLRRPAARSRRTTHPPSPRPALSRPIPRREGQNCFSTLMSTTPIHCV